MREVEKGAFLGTHLKPLEENVFKKETNLSKKEKTVYSNRDYSHKFRTNIADTVWVPKEFRSSRTEKAAITKQTPKEFMDDEDIGQFGIIPLRVQHTQQLNFFTDIVQPMREDVSSQPPLPKPQLKPIFHATLDAVGKQLLRNTGWDLCQETDIQDGRQRIDISAKYVKNMRLHERNSNKFSVSNFMNNNQLEVQRDCNKNANCSGLGYKDLSFAIDIHIGTKKTYLSSDIDPIVSSCGVVGKTHRNEELGLQKDEIRDFSPSTEIENNDAHCFSVERDSGFIPQNWILRTTRFSHVTNDKTNVLKEWLKRTSHSNLENSTSPCKSHPSRAQFSIQDTRARSNCRQSMANFLQEMHCNQESTKLELTSSKNKCDNDSDHKLSSKWIAKPPSMELHFSERFVPERSVDTQPLTMNLWSEATPVVRSKMLWLPHNLLCKEFKQKQNDAVY